MRVLHVISGIEPENGGPTAALGGLSRALRRKGVEVSIVATWKAKSAFTVADALRADGIETTLLGPTRRPFRNHPQLRATLEAEIAKADVVHIHAMWEAIEHTAAVVCRKLGKPYVWTPHGMLDRWNMRRNTLFKRLCLCAYLRRDLSAAKFIHVATPFEREQVERWRFGTPLQVIGLGVTDEMLNGEPPSDPFWRRRHGIPADVPFVLFLGRIQRGKGLEVLIPAMKNVDRRVHLVVAGPDEGLQLKMIMRATRNGVADRVKFIGMLDRAETRLALGEAALLAAPSWHENFGIAVAEAIAAGTAVVVSDQVGLASLINEKKLGAVTRLRPSAVAAGINACLQPDPDRAARCRAAARETFDWNAIAVHWIEAYRSAAGL